MKKAIIVHGWGGSPDDDWYSWLKEELKKKGWKVELPEMPDTNKPEIEKWVSILKGLEVKQETYFIGHSIGCQAIMRYLEKADRKIKGCIFVAGWFNLTDETWDEDYTLEIANPWLKTPINFNRIRKNCDKFVDIASDNDPYVPISDTKIFKEKLGAEIYILKDKGHISGEDGVIELPIVIEKLNEMAR